ncbi:hypothetical protein PENTCL1PPCAC_14713, partial [Pristionchus entomophagus]
IDQLSLDSTDCSCSDQAKVLIDFSSIVRSMSIVQNQYPVRPGQSVFVDRNIDWAQVIIEMFSRKLDKLYVENHHQ